MRKARGWLIGLATALVGAAAVAAPAHDTKDLPAGPIRDRHELMEAIGDHAENIGDAMKAGKTSVVANEAQGIALKAKQVTALFPTGSTDPKSRAKPEIWQKWADFERLAAAMGDDAAALAIAAGGADDGNDADMKAASQKLFKGCKSCHDEFRVPKKDEGN